MSNQFGESAAAHNIQLHKELGHKTYAAGANGQVGIMAERKITPGMPPEMLGAIAQEMNRAPPPMTPDVIQTFMERRLEKKDKAVLEHMLAKYDITNVMTRAFLETSPRYAHLIAMHEEISKRHATYRAKLANIVQFKPDPRDEEEANIDYHWKLFTGHQIEETANFEPTEHNMAAGTTLGDGPPSFVVWREVAVPVNSVERLTRVTRNVDVFIRHYITNIGSGNEETEYVDEMFAMSNIGQVASEYQDARDRVRYGPMPLYRADRQGARFFGAVAPLTAHTNLLNRAFGVMARDAGAARNAAQAVRNLAFINQPQAAAGVQPQPARIVV